MLNSILTIRIIEGRGIRNQNQEIVVSMSVEGQRALTEPVTAMKGMDPVWKEVITFDITTGREPLIVQVLDGEGGRVIGQGEVYLDMLLDQYKHDEWLQLVDLYRGDPAGRLLLNLHWIHSKRKFLQDILRIQDATMDEYA